MSQAVPQCEQASPGLLPLRVRVKSANTTIRPTVGLLVDQAWTFEDILGKALAFNDAFTKSEAAVTEILSMPMDIVVANRQTDDMDDAIRMQSATTIQEALMYDTIGRVVFNLKPHTVRLLFCAAAIALICLCCSDLPLLLRSAVVALCSRVR